MELNIRDITYHITTDYQPGTVDKPVLVSFHGFMGSSEVFEFLSPRLKDFCQPIFIDLLGHGQTEGSTDPDRYEAVEQIADLNEIFRKLELKRYFLHGYSMGGRLALLYALEHHKDLRGLILESTTYGVRKPSQRRLRQEVDVDRAKAVESDFSHFLDNWNRLPLFKTASRQVTQKHKEMYRSIQQHQEPKYIANSLRGFGTGFMPSAWSRLEELTIPTLLLAGDHDEKFRHLMIEMHQRMPNSFMRIISACGHRIHLEQPDRLAEIIHDFMIHH